METLPLRIRSVVLLTLSLSFFQASVSASPVNEGGDDVFVLPAASGNLSANNLFVTDSGILFNAFQVGGLATSTGTPATPVVFRSTDRGTTWTEWGNVPAAPGEHLFLEKALLTEGTVSRLHLLYSVESDDPLTDGTVRHAWTGFAGATPTWNVSTPFGDPSIWYTDGDLAVDAFDHSSYRVYAVTTGYDGVTFPSLHYARSTDQGTTWESEIVLQTGLNADFMVRRPQVAWGAGRVHVAWSWGDDTIGETSTDNGVQYRYATNFGANLGDFSPVQDLLPANVGPENNPLELLASSVSDEVYLLYSTLGFLSQGELWRSLDGGSTWNPANVIGFDPDDNMTRLAMNETGDRLVVSGVRRDDVGNVCRGQPVVQSGVIPSTSANLLVNASFEDPPAGGAEYFGAGSGWSTFGGGVFTVTDAFGPPHAGSQSLKLFGACCSGVFQQFPTTPGESWVGGAWIYNNPSDPMSGGQVAAVNIEWIQADGVTQSAILPFVSNGATTAGSPQGVWTYQAIQGIAPSDAAFARLTLITGDFAPGGPGGAPLYDDASFVRENPGPEFGTPMIFAADNEDRTIGEVVAAIDPSAPEEIGVSWLGSGVVCLPPADLPVRFDATWRNDPGYPVTEPGLPVPLAFAPAGPPTIAQLDADAFGEITWVDVAGDLHLVSHDGIEVASWPKDIGNEVLGGAVACGDLDGDGTDEMAYGDANGRLHVFNSRSGNYMPNFPLTLGSGSVRATIAPVAPPYPRSVVATVDQSVFVVSYRGQILESWNALGTMNHPAAVGDLDNDGLPEIVVLSTFKAIRLDPGQPTPTFQVQVGLFDSTTAPPTLVDLDQDLDREILVPMSSGILRALDHDGNSLWTYSAGTGADMGAVAAANLAGNGQPELAISSDDEIHLVDYNGASFGAYPQDSGAGPAVGLGGQIADPVLNSVQWAPANLIAGTSAEEAWAWVNLGGFSDGWPKKLDGAIAYAAATGDIDDDGRNEIVMLTTMELRVMDVGIAPSSDPSGRWPQWGNDAGHSFCHWSETNELVTATPAPGTSFSFAPPTPNPAGNRTTFAFTLPEKTELTLVLYDLRGRRVRTIADGSYPAGAHVVTFDGRSDSGALVANGVYMAVLRSRGKGVELTGAQRLVWLR